MNCVVTGGKEGRGGRGEGGEEHKMNVFLNNSGPKFAVPFIRFGQNLAWTYYLTLETSLWKNFFSKSKMAAGSQRFEIGQI